MVKRKHTNLIRVVSLGRISQVWGQWRGAFLIHFIIIFKNLLWVCFHFLVTKRTWERDTIRDLVSSLSSAGDQQAILRCSTNLDPNFNSENNFKRTTWWSFSALNFANLPAEGYGVLGPSVSYWQDLAIIHPLDWRQPLATIPQHVHPISRAPGDQEETVLY